MKVATWNVNSVRARLTNILSWLNDNPVDILLLQEIKCVDQEFPKEDFNNLGYNILVNGQKSYNGVAILSYSEPQKIIYNLPGDDAGLQRRYLQAEINGVVFGNVYLPNGNPINTEKFTYKLDWMKKLNNHAKALIKQEKAVVLAGDFNIIPSDIDAHDPAAWVNDALCQPESRKQFRELLNLGYTDALRIFHSEPDQFTFWDYQGGAWQNDYGIRIDHFLLSPQAADIWTDCRIDPKPRGRPKASDHTPILIEIK
jgi:exodeoxyribonuclease-3